MQALRIAGIVFLLGLSPALAQTAPQIETLRVTRTGDDLLEGSLRWAIERNNTAPGRYRIEIDPEGGGPHVIKPAALLPAVKGPVRIEGMPWRKSGRTMCLAGLPNPLQVRHRPEKQPKLDESVQLD